MHDIAIIGAGPAGLFAAFEAGMLGLSTVIIETLPHAGGQCSALYPEKPIYDIPAIPSIKAEDLTQNLLKQIERFNPTFHFETYAEAYTKQEDGTFVLACKTKSGVTQVQAKTIILAIGGGSFGPNRPPLEGIEAYEGTSVFYTVNNKAKFAGKNVVIAGGGDSAVDWAILLSEIANVSIVHRRNKFRAHEASLAQLNELIEQKKVTLYAPHKMAKLNGGGVLLESITLENIQTSEEININADALLPFFGLSMEIGAIKNWGLNFEEKYLTVNPQTMQTNVEGIFAIGDIITYPGKLKLILCGFSEAAMACYAVRSHLNPEKSFHFEYSTTAFNK